MTRRIKRATRPPKIRVLPSWWRVVDWSLDDSLIAAATGLGEDVVRRARAGQGLDTVPTPKIDWAAVDWSKTSRQIATETGARHWHVGRMRALHAPETSGPRARHDWGAVDWSRSTTEIAIDMGVRLSAVSHARRLHDPQKKSAR